MSTATILPPSATAVAVRNRLQRDLEELTRASHATTVLPADNAGNLFDLSCHMSEALTALTTAIADVDRYIADAQRAERLARQRAIAEEFNSVIFAN